MSFSRSGSASFGNARLTVRLGNLGYLQHGRYDALSHFGRAGLLANKIFHKNGANCVQLAGSGPASRNGLPNTAVLPFPSVEC